ISGIAVGLAYGVRFQPGNRLTVAIKAAKRAFTLYLAHMITTFMTLALFIWWQSRSSAGMPYFRFIRTARILISTSNPGRWDRQAPQMK
ncbi:OpgC domain-containing protein, partial [Rhizobium ruizarguesonis]